VTISNMKRRTLAGMIASTTLIMTTGCSTGGMSLASMNPFAKSATTATAATEPSMGAKISESFASTATGARNQLSTVGSTAKSAAGKTKATLTGFFKKSDTAPTNEISKTDPLSLENKPASIGPEVFVANGQLWESTGNFPKAMESYSKALESEPNNGPALTSIARLHFRQENYAQAAEFFQKAIQKSPEDAGLFNDLGLTLSKPNRLWVAPCNLLPTLRDTPTTLPVSDLMRATRQVLTRYLPRITKLPLLTSTWPTCTTRRGKWILQNRT
jgi:Tetratricopeptide repeat